MGGDVLSPGRLCRQSLAAHSDGKSVINSSGRIYARSPLKAVRPCLFQRPELLLKGLPAPAGFNDGGIIGDQEAVGDAAGEHEQLFRASNLSQSPAWLRILTRPNAFVCISSPLKSQCGSAASSAFTASTAA